MPTALFFLRRISSFLLSCEAPAPVCVSHVSIVIFSLPYSLFTYSFLSSRLLFLFAQLSIDAVIIYLHPCCIFTRSSVGARVMSAIWGMSSVLVGRCPGSLVPRTRRSSPWDPSACAPSTPAPRRAAPLSPARGGTEVLGCAKLGVGLPLPPFSWCSKGDTFTLFLFHLYVRYLLFLSEISSSRCRIGHAFSVPDVNFPCVS